MLSTKGAYPSKSVESTKGIRGGNGCAGRGARRRSILALRRASRHQLARLVERVAYAA